MSTPSVMRTRIGAVLAVAALVALGLWLWRDHGVAVWLESAVAFCL